MGAARSTLLVDPGQPRIRRIIPSVCRGSWQGLFERQFEQFADIVVIHQRRDERLDLPHWQVGHQITSRVARATPRAELATDPPTWYLVPSRSKVSITGKTEADGHDAHGPCRFETACR